MANKYIKLFSGILTSDLEQRVNNFLKTKDANNIVDIKGWSSGDAEGKTSSNTFETIMITYLA